MFAAKVKSYAKVNLSLNIAGTAGGYHLIDSVVCSIGVHDTVCARPRRDTLINVYMHGMGSERIPPEKNNAVRAGEAFVSAFGTRGADIEIYKDIPVGAGLGGSSADAAGVLNVLEKLYKTGKAGEIKALADALGSDTGYMLGGGFARLSGRGERVEKLAGMPLHFLLILPPTPVSTAECFAEYDKAPDALRAMFVYMNDNQALCGALMGPNGDAAFVMRIREMLEKRVIGHFFEPGRETPRQKYMAGFAVHGCVGTIVSWLQNGRQETPEEMSNLLWDAVRAIRAAVSVPAE